MSAWAIILARAGSKGVPGKNVRDVAGRPCIAWTILHAQRSARVSRVIVSTDDPRAMDVARSMGAEVAERPADLASDTARVDDAARHAAAWAREHRPDACATHAEAHEETGRGVTQSTPLAILYANVPVRPPELTDRALALLDASGCDSVQSYQRVGKHHPWWTARLDDAGRVGPWEGDVLNHGVFRRQDLPPAFVPDGGVIALTWRALMLGAGAPPGPHAFFGVDRRGIVNEEGSVVDIDAEVDVLVADALLRGRA
ncbi:MAG: acylneuraminate cytidylyltransferase family protein [Planctomycetota bacterium]|nr:acylneuraminate cytidylyltransferase family protein [Planctomycetota bacterium]